MQQAVGVADPLHDGGVVLPDVEAVVTGGPLASVFQEGVGALRHGRAQLIGDPGCSGLLR
jgi:hypothetical protein